MNADELAAVLARAFKESTKSGETQLDDLVRQAQRDPLVAEAIRATLVDLPERLKHADEWRALEILISLVGISSPTTGEAFDEEIARGELLDPESYIWVARCAAKLGATMSSDALDKIDRVEVLQSNPREWLALVLEVADPQLAERWFEEIPNRTPLTVQGGVELIRLFKRALGEIGLRWQPGVSAFLTNLSQPIALDVAERLQTVIGPTFAGRFRIQPATPPQIVRLKQPADFNDLFAGMRKVAEKTAWARGRAGYEAAGI